MPTLTPEVRIREVDLSDFYWRRHDSTSSTYATDIDWHKNEDIVPKYNNIQFNDAYTYDYDIYGYKDFFVKYVLYTKGLISEKELFELMDKILSNNMETAMNVINEMEKINKKQEEVITIEGVKLEI